jgi:tetratricopeptide (TPR) repeat protein
MELLIASRRKEFTMRQIIIPVLLAVNFAIMAAPPSVDPAECRKEGTSLFVQKKFKDAVRALERCSDDPATWEPLGLAYFELGYMDDAKNYLKKAIDHDPQNVNLQARYADAFAYNREFSKAVEEFKKLREKYPTSREVEKGLAQALGWNKHYDESIALYRDILKQDPKDYETWLQIGILTSWNKKFPEARAEFSAIINSKPPKNREIEARLKLAEVISWQKKLDESIREYDDIIALAPETIDAYLGKGVVLEWKGKYPEARKQYEKALQLDPQNRAAKARLEQLMWVQ